MNVPMAMNRNFITEGNPSWPGWFQADNYGPLMNIEYLEMIGRLTTTGIEIEVYSSLQKCVKSS